MEIAKVEIEAVEKVATVSPQDIADLNELQLSLIGGGTGDVQLG